MSTVIEPIRYPELFFGFVAPIGADLTAALKEFKSYFEKMGYRVVEVKVTDVFDLIQQYITPPEPLERRDKFKRYESYIKYGNHIRATFDDDAILAVAAVGRIANKRIRSQKEEAFARTAYLLHQFKRKEEVDLLRSVYGSLFFQVSIYSRRLARVDYLAREFAKSKNVAGPDRFRSEAEKIVQDDANEVGHEHGQRVGKIFHDADFILSLDASEAIEKQVSRVGELLFGSNTISPSHIEYGMFMAKAAALRTLDLSRQVGAAIFSASGEIVSLGSNEVPKATGGTYWSDGAHDDREYQRGQDSNDQRKKEILTEIILIIDSNADVDAVIASKAMRDSQFMDALEYGRIVHAEMSALSDAARHGLAVKGGTLYTTTFPCHMCAKHIVAAGIDKVVFLEPYPKSLASDLHADSIQIEGAERGRYRDFPAVVFEHFYGVTPRRYREFFERDSRKHKRTGQVLPYSGKNGEPEPIVRIGFPLYEQLEQDVIKKTPDLLAGIAERGDEAETASTEGESSAPT